MMWSIMANFLNSLLIIELGIRCFLNFLFDLHHRQKPLSLVNMDQFRLVLSIPLSG